MKQRSTCNNHKAVNAANAERHKLEATGIGATACSRHGCFYPGSVVDFQKGEQQKNMDYSLSQALAYNMPEAPAVLLMYDIMCQYGVHLRSRFSASPYLSLPDGIQIDKGIGLFHIHGHQDSCYSRFAPNFIPGTGQQDGEIIETLWWPLKLVSGSTRTMSSAHRREVLDDLMCDSNWKKLVGMG